MFYLKRRDLLTRMLQSSAGAVLFRSPLYAAVTSEGTRRLALPTIDQRRWQDFEIGMFLHFAPSTWQDVESDNLSTPLSEINPTKLDTDQWAQTAVTLGAKYVVFVAKHQGGFCMWQTKTTDYSIRSTPWKDGKGDVLGEVSASCKRHGLKLGVYVCPRDDHFGAKTGGVCATPELQKKYDAMYREQLTEVFTRYGELVEIWFDGSTVTPVSDLLQRYQPHAMVFQGPSATIRWVGNEEGFAPYPCWNGLEEADAKTGVATSLYGDPDGDAWMPVEADVSTRRPNFMWSTTNLKKLLTVDQLLSIYYRSVGHGAQLLLNVAPNRDGLIPDEDRHLVEAFGQEIKIRFGKPVGETSGSGTTISLQLGQPTKIDIILLQEEIEKGERIRAYLLEGRVDGTWKKLGEGTAIGQKHIQPIEPTTVDAIRLSVSKYAAAPALRRLAAFQTGTPPPADWNAPPQLWAANLVGGWKNNAFALDLTKKIDAAKLYRLRFIPRHGSVTAVTDFILKLHGVSEPRFVRPVKGKSDEMILDITGNAETIEISGKVQGAESGQILLQKL